MGAQNKTGDAGGALMPKITLILAMAAAAFWLLVQTIDPYRYAVVGVFYEILWLPGLLLLWAMPVFSLIMLVREKFSFKSLYLYALVISLVCLLQTVIFGS